MAETRLVESHLASAAYMAASWLLLESIVDDCPMEKRTQKPRRLSWQMMFQGLGVEVKDRTLHREVGVIGSDRV